MNSWRAIMLAFVVGLAASVGVLSTPAAACACGAFLLPQDEEVVVSREQAIISWDGAEQRIFLSMDIDSTSSDAALLIPTPAPATVSISEPSAFAEIANFTAPTVEQVELWWPDWLLNQEQQDPDQIDQIPNQPALALAGIEAEVIDSANAAELQEWLQSKDLVLRDNIASALVPYVQQGWSFVLIALDAQSLSGRLQPIEIRFETNQVVYPMRLSVAGDPLHVNTYVFANHRMERTDSMGGSLHWAGPVEPTDFSSQTLVDLAVDHPFLTAWRQSFDNPRNHIDGDMVFAAASSDQPFHETTVEVVRREILGTPAGPTLIFLGLVLVGAGGGLYSMWQRKRA